MREIADVLDAYARHRGEPQVLATVVRTSGSTYRRAGARMLITSDGWAAGSISGGCLEGDLLKSAWERTEDGPALVTFDASADADIVWGFGLGCSGTVQVLLERLEREPNVLSFLSESLSLRLPSRIATVVSAGERLGQRVITSGSRSLSDRDLRYELGTRNIQRPEVVRFNDIQLLIELVQPPQPLVIFGAGHDAIPVVRMAKEIGWHVTVVDRRNGLAGSERFPAADCVLTASAGEVGIDDRTAAVLMTHNYLQDLEILRALLRSSALYIGVLGPALRTQRLLKELQDDGLVLEPESLRRVHGPIGLDLGADGPDEIALSILGEIQAVLSGRRGGFLRDRTGPLHAKLDPVSLGAGETPACDLSA